MHQTTLCWCHPRQLALYWTIVTATKRNGQANTRLVCATRRYHPVWKVTCLIRRNLVVRFTIQTPLVACPPPFLDAYKAPNHPHTTPISSPPSLTRHDTSGGPVPMPRVSVCLVRCSLASNHPQPLTPQSVERVCLSATRQHNTHRT